MPRGVRAQAQEAKGSLKVRRRSFLALAPVAALADELPARTSLPRASFASVPFPIAGNPGAFLRENGTWVTVEFEQGPCGAIGRVVDLTPGNDPPRWLERAEFA